MTIEQNTSTMSYSQAVKSPVKEAATQNPVHIGKHSVCKQKVQPVIWGAAADISHHRAIHHYQVSTNQYSGKNPQTQTTDYSIKKKSGQPWYNRKDTSKDGKITYKDLRNEAKKLKEGYFRNEKGVTAENVLEANIKIGQWDGALNTALFLERMYKENRMLKDGKPVEAEMILKEYKKSIYECKKLINKRLIPNEKLYVIQIKLVVFYEYLYLNNITLNGENITPETIIDCFPDNYSGRYSLARFYNELYIRGKSLNSELVTAEMVEEQYQNANLPLEQTRFHEWLLINRRTVHGKIPDFGTTCNNFKLHGKKTDLSIFLSKCLSAQIPDVKPQDLIENSEDADPLTKATIHADLYHKNLLPGILPENIIAMFPSDTKMAKTARARFKRDLYLKTPRDDKEYHNAKAIIQDLEELQAFSELGIFYIELFSKGIFLPGKTSTPEILKETLEEMGLSIHLARFLQYLCLNHITINNRLVNPETVINAYKDAGGCEESMGIFYHSIYQKQLKINGQPVTKDLILIHLEPYPKALSKFHSYLQQSDESMVEMEDPEFASNYPAMTTENCMREFLANTSSSQLTAEQVLNSFPDTTVGNRSKAFFLKTIYLDGIPCENPPTAEHVADLYELLNDKLSLAFFYTRLYWHGLKTFRDKPLTRKFIIESCPVSYKGIQTKAIFLRDCLLNPVGSENNEKLKITTGMIENLYLDINAKRDRVMFLEHLYMKRIKHKGKYLTPEEIFDAFQMNNINKLTIGIFCIKLCLREIPLNGKPVAPEMIRNLMPDSKNGWITYIKFLEDLFFKGSNLAAKPFTLTLTKTPEENQAFLASNTESGEHNSSLPRVYPANPDDPMIQAEDIANLYKNGGYDFKHTLFIKKLALSGKQLNGKVIEDQTVLDLLNKSNKITDNIKIDYLIQRIQMEAGFDYADKIESLFIKAIRILKHSRPNNQIKVCRVKLLICALKFNLQNIPEIIDKTSPDIILKDIESISSPVIAARLKFYFFTECFLESWDINNQPVNKDSILKCLDDIPRKNMKTALKFWLDEEINFRSRNHYPAAHSLPEARCNSLKPVKNTSPGAVSEITKACSQQLDYQQGQADSNPDDEPEFFDVLSQEQFQKKLDNIKNPVIPLSHIPDFRYLYDVLSIISSLNKTLPTPEIIIFGSFSRKLQNLEKSFNDIDLLGTEKSIKQLTDLLINKMNNKTDDCVPVKVHISIRHKGCSALRTPDYFNITLSSGELITESLKIQCNIFPNAMEPRQLTEVTIKNDASILPIHILSFYDEAVLIGTNIEHMQTLLSKESIGALTKDKTEITRTVIFDKNPSITFKLMMRIMILLNKSVKFTDIFDRINSEFSEFIFKQDHIPDNREWFLKSVFALEDELSNHHKFPEFITEISNWLSTDKPTNTYEKRRHDFIENIYEKALLIAANASAPLQAPCSDS